MTRRHVAELPAMPCTRRTTGPSPPMRYARSCPSISMCRNSTFLATSRIVGPRIRKSVQEQAQTSQSVQAVAVTLRIRPRVDDDLDACEAIARATHAHDGYTAYVRDDDFRTFVARPGALGAWVAEIDGALGGHV